VLKKKPMPSLWALDFFCEHNGKVVPKLVTNFFRKTLDQNIFFEDRFKSTKTTSSFTKFGVLIDIHMAFHLMQADFRLTFF